MSNNLISRTLTALVLIPLVLALLFFAPATLIGGIGLLLLFGCGLEWLQLIPFSGRHAAWFMPLLAASFYVSGMAIQPYCLLGLITYALIFVALLFFPQSKPYWGKKPVVLFTSLLLLPLCWTSLVQIYHQPTGDQHLLYLLLLIWATDTGAYFTGKRFGTHRLIPAVSPGKTIEGALGGIVLAFGVSVAGAYVFSAPVLSLWYTQAFATIILAMIGDLFISMLKRRVNCKDTGHILPGHGGLLDRLDSLIAAAPVFYMLS